MELTDVAKQINESSIDSKIYIGCDSEVVKRGKAKVKKVRYTTVIVIHLEGSRGGRVFGIFEQDIIGKGEQYKREPKYRLMNEVYKVSDLYLDLAPLVDREIEVHLDLNPDEKHLSNKVANQAVGYVKGVCGVDAKLKPDAWAASACADRWHSLEYRQGWN